MIVKIIVISIFFAMMVLIQFPSLKKNKNLRDILTYTLLMLLAMLYTYGFILDIKLPNAIKLMEFVFKPVHEFMLSIII